MKNDRHPVMHRTHNLVRPGRNNRAGGDFFSFALPLFPDAGEGESLSVFHAEVKGLLLPALFAPLEKSISRDQAGPALERSSETRLLDNGFSARVDEPAPVFTP